MSNQLINKEFSLALSQATGSLDNYIHTVNAIPILSAEQEKSLALQLQQDNNLDAAQQLVMAKVTGNFKRGNERQK